MSMFTHMEMIALARHRLSFCIRRPKQIIPIEVLSRSRTGTSTIDTPRLDQPPIIMYTDLAFGKESIKSTLCIAAAEISCATGIGQRLVCLDDEGVI